MMVVVVAVLWGDSTVQRDELMVAGRGLCCHHACFRPGCMWIVVTADSS